MLATKNVLVVFSNIFVYVDALKIPYFFLVILFSVNNLGHVKRNSNNMGIPDFSVRSMIFKVEFHVDHHVWNHRLNPYEARRSGLSSEMNYHVSRTLTLTDCTVSKEFLFCGKATRERFQESSKPNPFDCPPSAK